MKPKRTKVPISVELASQIDELVGRRRRSTFVEETAGPHIEKLKQQRELEGASEEPSA